jgi:hypothetical protein
MSPPSSAVCLFNDQPFEGRSMTATYTFDVFSSLDGFGAATGNWTGYWGKQGQHPCWTAFKH